MSEEVEKKEVKVNIFEVYGKLMVEKEILDGKIMQVKQAIQKQLNEKENK